MQIFLSSNPSISLSLPFPSLHHFPLQFPPLPQFAPSQRAFLNDMLLKTAGVLTSLVTIAQASSYQATWYPPTPNAYSNVTSVLHGNGAPGIYTSSSTPNNLYGQYNWCNAPHARKTEYVVPSSQYQLQYVEVVQRHQKRTPYASNTFPVENNPWDCGGALPAHYLSNAFRGAPGVTPISWQAYTDEANNPFTYTATPGFVGSNCAFPQITDQGLQDSFQHGQDFAGVYRDLLGYLPARLDPSKHSFRVTNNVITSQVLGGLIAGVFGPSSNFYAAYIQSSNFDSLEPTISCPYANTVLSTYLSSTNATWLDHLNQAQPLYNRLDAISGISNPDNGGWHTSFDHYYDRLSAGQCHAKHFPCSASGCISQEDANTVYRLGQYEYFYKFRSTPQSATYSFLRIAPLLQEIRAHMRNAAAGTYRHNVAHDGTMSLLLGALQISAMEWPALGSELIFEVWASKRGGQKKLRILWGGKPLKTSTPLGTIDMIPIESFYTYLQNQLPADPVGACQN